tara:strand:- start:73 stop:2136 length:2064 start_codon:yes stop_codon:yes gene_type:complete
MNYWEKLIEGFSFKSKGGAPDFSNPNDRLLLRMELMKKGWTDEAVNEFLHEVDLVRKKQDDGGFGSAYAVKQFNPDRGQKLVKKDASAQDIKKAQDSKEKEKSTDTDKSDKGNVEKQKPIEKDKSLGEVDRDYYDKDVEPSDEEYEKSKPEQQKLKDGESPTKLPDDIFGSPSKVPKKYIKLVERLINSRYVNQTTPPITSMINASGAGKIQAQAAEVLSMIGPTLNDDEMKNLMDTIRKHNEKLPQQMRKLKDGTLVPYKPPRYEKGSEPILSEDWLQSVESVRGGIKSRLDATYGEGNWEVENGAWDLKGDVEAMGLSDYGRNKGFSTDMYLRVKTPDGSILDEVSLKKNLDIFLSQPSANAVNEWGLTDEEKNEIEEINIKLKDAKGKVKKELNARKKEIMAASNSRIPDGANPKVFNRRTTESATEFYEKISKEQHEQIQKLDENDEDYIAKLSKTTGQSKDYCRVLIKTMKNLKHPYSRDELRQTMIDNGFVPKKTTNPYQDKFSVMMMRTLATEPINDNSSEDSLKKHLQIGKDFNKSFVENMVEEPYKSGVMNTIREKFPLKALMDGEEKMSLGGVNADPEVMQEIFGTTDYDEVQEKLSIEGPDDRGEYQLVFQAEVGGEVTPISTIAPRQRGLGYEPVVNLEMNLHPAMKEKLYCANKKIGRNVPEAEQYDKKYKCEV